MGETETWQTRADRVLVMGALYGRGPAGEATLVRENAVRVFLTCDGFGHLTPAAWQSSGIGWDMSHVRDATPGALHRAATLVRALAPEITARVYMRAMSDDAVPLMVAQRIM